MTFVLAKIIILVCKRKDVESKYSIYASLEADVNLSMWINHRKFTPEKAALSDERLL